MDARELDEGTHCGGHRRHRCQLPPTLAEDNGRMEMEFDTHVLDWIGGGLTKRDGLPAGKESGKGEWWTIWETEILGNTTSDAGGMCIKWAWILASR